MTLLAVFRNEIGRVFSLRPVISVVVVAAVVYALFYPQPYLNEALRKVPIAVVDLDRTQTSRELARLVDATPDVAVAQVLPDVPAMGEFLQDFEASAWVALGVPKKTPSDIVDRLNKEMNAALTETGMKTRLNELPRHPRNAPTSGTLRPHRTRPTHPSRDRTACRLTSSRAPPNFLWSVRMNCWHSYDPYPQF